MTSLFAALLSFHNVLARYFFALGNGGALPAACGRSHPRHLSPHVASLTQSISALAFLAVFALAGMDPVTQVFAWMAGTATLGVLALMALTCAAVIVFFRRTGLDRRPWHTVVAPGLGLARAAALPVADRVQLPHADRRVARAGHRDRRRPGAGLPARRRLVAALARRASRPSAGTPVRPTPPDRPTDLIRT